MWQLLVFSRVLSAHVATPILLKRIIGLPSRTRRFAWQFGFCFVFSAILADIVGTSLLTPALLAIAGIGILNSFGAYFHWRAIDKSLSKTSFFTQADDLIAISLAFFILGEGKTNTAFLNFGIVLCVVAAVSFSLTRNKEKNGNSWRSLAMWIAGYSIIWGAATFFMRYFAKTEIPLPGFLLAWYGGSFVGSLLIAVAAGKKERGIALEPKAIGGVGILAVAIWLSLLLNYAAFQNAPLVVVQPVFQVTEMVFPTLIGLWIFKEGKGLVLREKVIFVGGIIGTIVISIAF